MKKEDVASLIIYLIMIGVAIIIGLSVIQDMITQFGPAKPFGLVLLSLFIGLILNVVLLEVLHAIGAKIGGYKVVSVNILGICFERKNKKLSCKIKDFDGLTGETKIAPNKEKLNLKPFIWLPIFGYAAEVASCVVIYSQIVNADATKAPGWMAISAIIFIVISTMIALYNLVPIKLDSMTDGYRMVLLAKEVNKEAYNELLRVEDIERNGEVVNEIKVFNEITEFTANLNLISVYHYLGDKKYQEAEEIIDVILADTKHLDPNTVNRVIAQKLYISLLTKDLQEGIDLYNEIAKDEIRRFIANDISLECIRSYVLISGLIDESESEVKYAVSKVEKANKKALKSRLTIEESLLKIALEKVKEKHSNWEI